MAKKTTKKRTSSSSSIPDNEYPSELQDEEEKLLQEDESAEQPPTDIVAFNELRSCADLMRMYTSNQLEIQPDFQRDVVWQNAAQTRFIDSLTKQLPIPSMCISLDYKTGERLVIDGLQRMWSIIQFLTNEDWKLSQLKDIDERISGKRVSYIKNNYKNIYGQVENLTIPITVLRCDYSKPNHMEYLFTIFHRLNTGGNKLTNQEIRNCIYSGELNDLLRSLVDNKKFRDLFGLSDESSYRFAYEEFILRFFTFFDNYEDYYGNLSQYLNRYMEQSRYTFNDAVRNSKTELFTRTVTLIYDRISEGGELPKLSKATIESVFVGIGRNIDSLESKTKPELKKLFKELRSSEEFHPDNLKNATTTKVKLIKRMKRAEAVFSK